MDHYFLDRQYLRQDVILQVGRQALERLRLDVQVVDVGGVHPVAGQHLYLVVVRF